MKLTRKEFEQMLAYAKSATGDARKAMIDNLRAASVVDVDEKGVETPVELQIADIGDAQGDVKNTKGDPDQIAKVVRDAVDAALKAAGHKPPIEQPATKAFAIPAGVRFSGSLKGFLPREVNGFTPEQRAYRFAKWAMAAMGNSAAKAFCDEHNIGVKIHTEGSNGAGGYLVPDEFGTDMVALMEKYGVARQTFKIRQMTSDTRSDPRRVSGLTAHFASEAGAGTESTKGWDRVNLVAKKLMVLSRISSELNEDSAINIGDDLMQEIALAFTLKEDQCGFRGDGSPTYGGITGIAPKLIAVNGVDDGGGLVLASGNAFSEFVLGDFNKVVGRLPQYADGPNTKWIAHRTFYYGTMQRLELASGGVTAFEVREGNRIPKFLGYDVLISQVMPSADANSQVACTLGDHAQAASFGDRRQTTISFSTDATVGGESVFERDEIAVKGTERIDINVHDVGSATVAGPVVGLISAAG